MLAEREAGGELGDGAVRGDPTDPLKVGEPEVAVGARRNVAAEAAAVAAEDDGVSDRRELGHGAARGDATDDGAGAEGRDAEFDEPEVAVGARRDAYLAGVARDAGGELGD